MEEASSGRDVEAGPEQRSVPEERDAPEERNAAGDRAAPEAAETPKDEGEAPKEKTEPTRRDTVKRSSGRSSEDSGTTKRRTGSESSASKVDRKRSSGRNLDSKIAARKKEQLEAAAEPDPAIAAAKAAALMLERRLLFLCTALIGVAAVVWIVSISTQFWFIVESPHPAGIFMANYSRYFLYSQSGLFSICRFARKNGTDAILSICRKQEMFPSADKYDNTVLDDVIINYTRTELFFSIVSLILMIMGFLFSIYTFRNPRYMFKRLAAGIHFLSAASVMVVIEVVINSIYYEKDKLPYVHPPGATFYYHYSFYLGWVVFFLNCASSITFLLYSKKRKGDKAPTEEIAMADEPTIIGR